MILATLTKKAGRNELLENEISEIKVINANFYQNNWETKKQRKFVPKQLKQLALAL